MEENPAEAPDTNIPPVGEESMDENGKKVDENDDVDECLSEYKNQMVASGLCEADVEYFCSAYKNLEEVKFIKLHCTSCDKHIGSAPVDMENRYEHPLLKVLVCGNCFQFYSSGDFEKDEDGSELYCRWCGEGGQVFCCTTCPFVFCKKCIRRNLGRGIAKTIENSDNWLCFSCDPSQISRHRATYWAIQKYSDEVLKKSKLTGDTEGLSVDGNICCSSVKKRADIYTKLMQPPRKKQKLNKDPDWQPPLISEEDEDEVICTPDILPLEPMDESESPPRSPIEIEPIPINPMVPIPSLPILQHKGTVPMPVMQQIPPPLMVRPPMKGRMTISELQKQLENKYSQIVVTPKKTPPLIVRKSASLMPRTFQNNGNFKIILPSVNSVPITTVPQIINSNYVVRPMKQISNLQTPVTNVRAVARTQSPCPTSSSPVPTTSKGPTEEVSKDWFDQALIDCAELTEYISTKISSLSSVHVRAYKSELLMEELHNTFQTYMHVAFEKINKIRRVTQKNYETDMERVFRGEKMKNPFALKNVMRDDLPIEKPATPDSLSEKSNSRDSFQKSKTKLITTKNIQPEEVLFDMDVTNASDEESANSKPGTPMNDKADDSDSDVEIVIDEKRNEVIHIVDSDDETEEKEKEEAETFDVSPEKLEEIKTKFNIQDIPTKELIKYLSAKIILDNKTTPKDPELPPQEALSKEDLQRNAENKLVAQIERILKDTDSEKISNDITSGNAKDGEIDKNKEKNHKEDDTSSNCEETEGDSDKMSTGDNEEHTNSKKIDNDNNTEEKINDDRSVQNGEPEKRNSDKDDDDEMRSEENKKEFKGINNISEQENTNCSENIDNSENQCTEEEGNKFFGDIEEILGSSVVMKKNTSFGDAFSKFVSQNDPEPEDMDENESIDDELEDKNNVTTSEIDETSIKDDKNTSKNDTKTNNGKDSENTDVGKAKTDKTKSKDIENSDVNEAKTGKTKSKDSENADGNEAKTDKTKSKDNKPVTTESKVDDPTAEVNRSCTPEVDIEVARELEMIPEYVKDICNKDNGSLSLPPDSISSISTSEIEMLMEGKVSAQNESDASSKNNSDSDDLNSEILALQQMAENCVTSVDVHKNSTECKG